MFKRRKKTIACFLLVSVTLLLILFNSVVPTSWNWYKRASNPLKRNERHRRHSSTRSHCEPKKNIVFVKTHKTASSTVTNILHRHGDRHNLVFALPRSGQYRLDWPWSLRNSSFQLVSGTQPNIVCHHGRYNRKILQNLMPRDTVYVTILRHPIYQYESTFNYMAFDKLLGIKNRTNPIEHFLENPKEILVNYLLTKDLRVNSDRLKLIRNGMSFDLGLNSTHFDDKAEVEKFLRILRKQFDLVMIAEFFDESIVLLKELLCWPLKDFSYFNLNVRYQNRTEYKFSEKIIDAMRRWNNVDFKIYDQFLKIFLQKISQRTRFQSGFHDETSRLRRENKRLRELCLRKVTKTRKGQYGVEVKRLELNGGLEPKIREMCDRIRRSEVDYLMLLRAKQYGFFESLFLVRIRKAIVTCLRFFLEFLTKT